MSNRRIRGLCVCCLILGVLSLAACGGDDGESAADMPPPAATGDVTEALPLPAAAETARTDTVTVPPAEATVTPPPTETAPVRPVDDSPAPATQPVSSKPVTAVATSPTGGGYSLQLGSFVRQENAETLRERLEQLGHNAVIEPAVIDGVRYHRVVLPGFGDRDTATQVGDALRRRLDIDYLIRRQP